MFPHLLPAVRGSEPRRMLGLTALAAIGWTLLLLVISHSFTLSFRTNDDAEMMAAVSGYDGGPRRPEMLFTSVLIGHALRALYDLAPGVPWYGLYLHVAQILALALTTTAIIVLSQSWSDIRRLLGIGLLVVFAVGFMVSIQFTIVAFLLVLAGSTTMLAVNSVMRRPILAGAVGGALAGLGGLIRFQSFGAAMALAVLALAVRVASAPRVERAPLIGATLTFVTIGVLVVVAAGIHERAWWIEQSGRELSAVAQSSQIIAASSRADAEPGGAAQGVAGEMRQNWMLDSALYATDRAARELDATPLASTQRVTRGLEILRALIGSLPSGLRVVLATSPWFLAVSVLILAIAAKQRAVFLASGAFFLASLVLMAVVAATRFPDRVALPLQLTTLILLLLLTRTDPARRWVTVRVERAAAVILLSVGLASGLTASLESSAETDMRRERAELFLEEIHQIDPEGTFTVWLIDAWNALEPLAFDQQRKYQNSVIQVAGWQYLLPHHDMDARTGDSDWVEAFLANERIYIIASGDRVALFQQYLREFRGMLCTEPVEVGTTRGGRDVVIQSIREVPCRGQAITQ